MKLKLKFGALKSISIGIIFFISVSAYGQSAAAVRLYEKGLAKQDMEDYYGASEDFQQALQINPAYGEAWFHLSQVTYAVGDYSLALTYLDSADKYAKNRTDILNLRGMTYISLGRLEDARKTFNSVIKTYPNDIESRFGLAELDVFNGSLNGAQKLYLEALKRQTNNRKALLSLALLSDELGNDSATRNYVDQALKYHSGDAEVHYLAAYLEKKQGNLSEAERRARSAIQIKKDYRNAYVLLASVLYEQKRYADVIDICDYLVSKNRKTTEAWYLKGLSQLRQNNVEAAISTWSSALVENEQDEILRAALELLVMKELPLEDTRRSTWTKYHVRKARDYNKIFMGEEARYEYQRALKLDPNNAAVRAEFAELLSRSGLNEIYLNQLKFIQEKNKNATVSVDQQKVADIIEAYDSLMKYSLSSKWNVDPFYLDKIRWHIGVFFTKTPSNLIHADAEEFVAGMASDIFSGISTTSVAVEDRPVSGYGEAYRLARQKKLDYFVLFSVNETDREVSIDTIVYSGRTGTETTRFSYFRTGNDRLASVLRMFRRDILNMLPVRGKIINRSVNELLIDLGKVEGMKEGAVLDIVKAGKIQTVDKGLGVSFSDKDLLGKITVSKVGEEICQGTLAQNGFYDRVNEGDEVLVNMLPSDADASVVSDTAPAAGEDGNRILPETSSPKIKAEDLGIVKTPMILDLLRNIK